MLREYLSNIADKFRTYLDTTEPINAQDFAGKVEDVAVRYNQLGFTNGYNLGLEEGKPLGKLELLQDSEYMNANVSGTAISVNDVNAVEHSVGCSVASKNMFDISKVKTTQNAIINNGDGSLTIKAWATTATSPNALKDYCPRLRVGDTATLSCNSTATLVDGTYTEHLESIYLLGVNKYWKNGTSMSLTQEILDSKVYFYCSKIDGVFSDATWSNIQVELGTTATAYTPYVADVGGIEVSRYGKNLFDKSNYVVDDVFIGFDISSLEIGKTYTFSSSFPIALLKISSNGNGYNSVLNATNDLFNTFTFVMAKHENISPTSKQYIFIRKERVEDPFVGNISELDGYDFQLEEGTTATPYEPFTKQTYQSTADGTVEGVKSISPNMTLLFNNNGVVINANYLRDIDTYIDNLKTNVALTGGE